MIPFLSLLSGLWGRIVGASSKLWMGAGALLVLILTARYIESNGARKERETHIKKSLKQMENHHAIDRQVDRLSDSDLRERMRRKFRAPD